MNISEKIAQQSAPPDPEYIVKLQRGTGSQVSHLPGSVADIFGVLYDELHDGPKPDGWSGFGQLTGQKGQLKSEKRFYCHINVGRPTYVVCWRLIPGSKEIEIYFAGTHSNAPYW